MKTRLLVINMVLMVAILSGCETLKGTATGATTGAVKDVKNTTAVACATGKSVAAAFNPGDEQHSRGTIFKVDDWIKENLW